MVTSSALQRLRPLEPTALPGVCDTNIPKICIDAIVGTMASVKGAYTSMIFPRPLGGGAIRNP